MGLWILAGLSMLGTAAFGAFAGYGFWFSHHMATEGVTTTAVVTEVDWNDDVTVDFTTETGQAVTTEIIWFSFDVPDVDDDISITYDPDDVYYAVPAGSDEDTIMAVVLAVIAGVGLLVAVGSAIGAALVQRARSRNLKALWAGAYPSTGND